jgi:hypothetical protein
VEDFELYGRAVKKDPSVRDRIYDMLLKGVTIGELADLGYDENEPAKPFSLDMADYDEFRRIVCETIEIT